MRVEFSSDEPAGTPRVCQVHGQNKTRSYAIALSNEDDFERTGHSFSSLDESKKEEEEGRK